MAKRGRPKKPGKRHPGGQLVQASDGPSIIALQRILSDAVKLGLNPLIGTQLGRLGFTRALTPVEVATGFRIAEIYGRYERSIGRRRSVASPSYEMGRGRDAGAPESADARETAHDAARDFGTLQAELKLCPRGVRMPLEELCVEDRACPPGWLPAVKIAFGILAGPLRTKSPDFKKSANKLTEKLKPLAVELKVNLEREAFIETVTRLGFVAAEDAPGVYGHFRALMEREKFRKGKERA
jgi:hypothetical protein